MKTQAKPKGALNGVVGRLRAILAAESADQLGDHELLERFVRDRDEPAFTALVLRHGPMALGVCQRVLQNPHDAEDACQAAFLVLARKASSIRKRESLTSWLHGVAYRVAANLRKKIARRRAHEQKLAEDPMPAGDNASWQVVKAVLDEELERLPDHFRDPLLLCYLEGRTRDEAAQELGWSLTTLRGRLDRARQLLGKRLARRGVALSATLLSVLLGQHAAVAGLPPTLVVATVNAAMLTATGSAAAGAISAHVMALADGVLTSMWAAKAKLAITVAILLVGVGIFGVGAGVMLIPPAHDRAQAFVPPGRDERQNIEIIGDQKPPDKETGPAPLVEPPAKQDHAPKAPHDKRLHGVVKSVHPDHHSVSVTVKEHGHDMTRSYTLSRDARIVLGSKNSSIQSLRAGMVADLVLTNDEKEIAEIKIIHQ